MLNASVIRFYNNFNRTFIGSENMTTKSIENWPLSTTPLLVDTSAREICWRALIRPLFHVTTLNRHHRHMDQGLKVDNSSGVDRRGE